MLKLPPGGVFRREARWMLVVAVLIPLAGFGLAVVIPWIARTFR